MIYTALCIALALLILDVLTGLITALFIGLIEGVKWAHKEGFNLFHVFGFVMLLLGLYEALA